MRNEPNIRVEQLRQTHPALGFSDAGANWGYFEKGPLRIISSGVDTKHGWEHVSVSCENRTPTWDEMCRVKKLFWRDDETVVQFHPKESECIEDMPYCLHLWKKVGIEYELPPGILVGVRKKG
jgi:hypothetical protein